MFSKEKLSTIRLRLKLIVAMLLLVLPFVCFSQGDGNPYKYMQREGMKVYFESVYETSGIKKDSLVKILIEDLSQKQGVINVRAQGDNIIADLDSWKFDYKKYGYRDMTVPIGYRDPFWGSISISVKDGKYKTVVNNIIGNKKTKVETRVYGSSIWDGMMENNAVESYFLKMNSDKGWATNSNKIKINRQFETELHNLFIVKEKKDW